MKAFNPSKELKPKKYKKIKIAIPIIIAVIISIMIGRSLANYSVYQELEIINAVVGEFSTGLNLAKDCSGQAAGKCLSQLGEDKYGNQIANDDPAQNPRYIGATPDNYVEFNGELWRIIGVFNIYVCDDNTSGVLDTYKDSSTCKKEKLLKIIKNEFLSTSMKWDSGNVNDWSKASLQIALNADYFKKNGDYANNGLNEAAQEMVANVVWTLGGPRSDYTSKGTPSYFYTAERGDTVPSGNPKAFVGHVGLMFPSDYGYATGGGTTYKRDACLQKEMYNWDIGSYKTDCAGGSWLYNSSTTQWILSPFSDDSHFVFYVGSNDSVGRHNAYDTLGVRPVVYLKSSVQIVDGTGKVGDPYKLSA